jgi:hypothetical protein
MRARHVTVANRFQNIGQEEPFMPRDISGRIARQVPLRTGLSPDVILA